MKKIIALMCVGLMLAGGLAFAGWQEGDLTATVTNIGTAEPLTTGNIPFQRAIICAEQDNSGTIVIGSSTAVASAATRRGIPIVPIASTGGECVRIDCGGENCGNLNAIYIDTTVDTDGVNVWYSQNKVI